MTDALAPRFPDAHVVDVEVVEVRQVTNTHVLVRIRYDGPTDAPEAAFCKLPPLDPERRALIARSQMGPKEVLFYTRLAPTLPEIRVPDIYVARQDPTDHSFAIVMEDLTHAGCRVPDGTWGIQPDSAARALEDLARLHVRYEDPARRDAEVPWAPAARDMRAPGLTLLRYGLDHRRDKLSDTFARAAEIYIEHHAELIDLWAGGPGPATVVHGDPHIGNLFFDGDRVGFLDWGMSTIGPPLKDVSYFLTMGVEPEDRRRMQSDLLKHYLDVRRSLGGTEISFDDAWAAHRVLAGYNVIASFLGLTAPYNAPSRRVFSGNFRKRAMMALDDLETVDALRAVLR